MTRMRYFGTIACTSIILGMTLLFATAGFQQTSANDLDLKPESQHPVVTKVFTRMLSNYHYAKKELDDSVSAQIFDYYIESLDPNRSYFLAQDVDSFAPMRYQLDDDLAEARLASSYHVYNKFIERVDERIEYVLQRLESPFDFTIDEYYVADRSEMPWPQTKAELDEIWRKRLKNQALNLVLTGKDWAEVKKSLTNRYNNFKKRIHQNNSEDVFQIFMNSVAQAYDPHSNYMSPVTSDNFGIQMSLSLQGIGAQLTSEFDYTKVVRIIPGGPADRSKLLWPDDRIVGVGQGEDGEIEDVIGMRLDDVVQQIRGRKGTIVRLEILPASEPVGGKTKIITLLRDKIVLTEREAKSDTFEVQHEGKTYKLGIIDIPTFYADLQAQQRGEKEYKSTTRDVRNRIEELLGANIDGLIIDLRDNSGGSLQEAVELTGLFIEEGPIVQVRNQEGRLRILKDRDRRLIYDGPLAVIVNRRSASASEIFAAAIQDYDRGIILGNQTFGKGTVQQLYGFDRYIRNANAKLGQAKLTVAKFYRVAGGTTQLHGVTPDIVFPSVLTEWDFGEDTEENSLPYDQIDAVGFDSWNWVNQYSPHLKLKSEQRLESSRQFEFINEDIELFRERNAIKAITLNQKKRKMEREQREEEEFARENERRVARGLQPLKEGEEQPTAQDLEPGDDPYVDEAAHVLADLIGLSSPQYHQYHGKVERR